VYKIINAKEENVEQKCHLIDFINSLWELEVGVVVQFKNTDI
jgi:hypothetical protein